MYLSTLLGTFAMTANTAFASYAIVHNNCNFTIWVTSVQLRRSPIQRLAPGENYSEEQKVSQNGVGSAVQVLKSEVGLYTGAPILTMAYSLVPEDALYYSLSTANGFDFNGDRLRIHNTNGLHVEEIVWTGEPKPDYTAAYKGDADLTLELCDNFIEKA